MTFDELAKLTYPTTAGNLYVFPPRLSAHPHSRLIVRLTQSTAAQQEGEVYTATITHTSALHFNDSHLPALGQLLIGTVVADIGTPVLVFKMPWWYMELFYGEVTGIDTVQELIAHTWVRYRLATPHKGGT